MSNHASIKRVFLIVLDSFGIGAQNDAPLFGDSLSVNTLCACAATGKLEVPNLRRLGLFNIDGVACGQRCPAPVGAYGRLLEKSRGKDTTTGHWEIAGLISPTPMPTYPDGFPQPLIDELERRTGRGVLCNKPYSGTQVIADYGPEQIKTGKLIVYTSADSVFQIAAHEKYIGLDELYRCCEIARALLQGEHAVGRVIARPYVGEAPNFTRTANRHDYSLRPPRMTMLQSLSNAGKTVIGVGKIHDIFAGQGVGQTIKTAGNADGMAKTAAIANQDFEGLCFVNLVDFDSLYGHRNDAQGYALALCAFDRWLGGFMEKLRAQDLLMITADHGCDPSTSGTDHTRESVPLLIFGKAAAPVNLGVRASFADIGQSIVQLFGAADAVEGESFLNLLFPGAPA
jgi:phosphopentomutase